MLYIVPIKRLRKKLNYIRHSMEVYVDKRMKDNNNKKLKENNNIQYKKQEKNKEEQEVQNTLTLKTGEKSYQQKLAISRI